MQRRDTLPQRCWAGGGANGCWVGRVDEGGCEVGGGSRSSQSDGMEGSKGQTRRARWRRAEFSFAGRENSEPALRCPRQAVAGGMGAVSAA